MARRKEPEFAIFHVRIVALRAGAGRRLRARFGLEHGVRLVAIETEIPDIFHQQMGFFALVGFMTDCALPVRHRRMDEFGFL